MAARFIQVYPVDEKSVLWRYLDFSKYVSLLENENLYFCPAYYLRQADYYEMRIPKPYKIEHKENIDAFLQSKEYDKRTIDLLNKQLESEEDSGLHFYSINCWQLSEIESNAMWKVYLSSSEGVAIKSSVKRLSNSLLSGDLPYFAGQVQYINYDKEKFINSDVSTGFEIPFHKSSFFKYEEEYRISSIIMFEAGTILDIPEVFGTSKRARDSLYHPVDLEILIEEVYVSPYSSDWFYELVKTLTNKYISPHVKVRRSDIMPV